MMLPGIPQRVLVCGSRHTDSYEWVAFVLSQIREDHPFEVLIHGGAKGVDSLAERYAYSQGIEVETYHAMWKRDGRAAGPLRNQQMIEEGKPTIGIVFKGGIGTADMRRRLVKAHVPILDVGDTGDYVFVPCPTPALPHAYRMRARVTPG